MQKLAVKYQGLQVNVTVWASHSSQDMMSTRVLPMYDGPTKNFFWSFKPILNFIQFVTINLEPPKPNQTLFWKTLNYFYFLFSVLVVVIANSLSIVYTVRKFKMTLSSGVELMELFLFPIGIQLGFFIFQQRYKTAFWKLINQIEIEFGFENTDYRRFRNFSVAGVAFIILWVSKLDYQSWF